MKLASTPSQWLANLAQLPSITENGGKIPAFFLGHGSPAWIWPKNVPTRLDLGPDNRPGGKCTTFLGDFGRVLVEKYNPKGIVIFSAHWDEDEPVVTDYGESNPLLYDYYGFPKELYTEPQFKSQGDPVLSRRVLELLKAKYPKARLTTADEPRGRDGRGFMGPGLDHGVFVPLIHMFPKHAKADAAPLPIPVVQVSIDASLVPTDELELGAAVSALRSEGILILSGGLTIHTFADIQSMGEQGANAAFKAWDQDVDDAVSTPTSPPQRKRALLQLAEHPMYEVAHPRADHFVPLYVAAGAGQVGEEDAMLISDLHAAPTFAFGLQPKHSKRNSGDL